MLVTTATVQAQHKCANPDTNCNYRHTGHIANGGVFTPKGDLRVLLVFVSYGEPYDSFDIHP